jgi:2-polyprenyl-3-methyl-5-hydroxy-6-metoxy-1,4-benzoquinol methylase
MSQQDRLKWNNRYAEGAYAERPWSSRWLQEWLDRIPRGKALDIACGAGRNALFLAANGFDVDAVDISGVALARAREEAARAGVRVNWIERDLDDGLPVTGPYQLVIQLRYVNAAVTRAIASLLAPGGMFLCEQHLQTEEPVAGPQGPQFRVAPGQLAELVPGLEIIDIAEGLQADPDGQRVALSRLIARKPQRG